MHRVKVAAVWQSVVNLRLQKSRQPNDNDLRKTLHGGQRIVKAGQTHSWSGSRHCYLHDRQLRLLAGHVVSGQKQHVSDQP